METKNSIRKTLKKSVLLSDSRLRQSKSVCKKLIELTSNIKYKNILLFMPLKDEIDITDFTKYLLSNKKNVYVPISFDDSVMRFYSLTDLNSLKIGKYGIPEPDSDKEYVYDKSDLIIVPGLAFDKNLNRLGRGKGYYDIFLNKYNLRKIAVCFDEQLIENIPVEEHDVKMDVLVTEKYLIERAYC